LIKDDVQYRFGDKIRAVRERKGVTLKQVADKAGVSESLISQIERNRVSPSIDTLLNIANVLGIDLDYLFSDYRQKRKVDLVRCGERQRLESAGVSYSQLSLMQGGGEEHGIEAYILEIAAGCGTGRGDYGHVGREMGYILEGEGTLNYGAEKYELREGDCISFSSDIPHVLNNPGQGPLRALWVITPPKMLFFRS